MTEQTIGIIEPDLDLIARIAEGDANKVWFVPTDVAGVLGQLGIGDKKP